MLLQEIAKLAGVSPATASRVFNHHPNVRAEVREQVLAIAQEHGYQPRQSSRQKNVVIFLPDDQIYPIRNCLEMVMMALTLELPKRGYRIEVMPLSNLSSMSSAQFSGAIAIGANPDDFKTWPENFTAPLILVDREAPGHCDNVFSVRSDESQGMALAIDHLYERGCTKIGAIIYGALGARPALVRKDAVSAALQRRGLPVNEALVHIAEDDKYIEIIGKMLQQGIDGLFCPGGNAGIITAYALSLYNKRVPEDISLVTSEHKLFSRYATPPQTTITQDHMGLASLAVDIIESHFENSPSEQHSVLEYSLVTRDSVVHG